MYVSLCNKMIRIGSEGFFHQSGQWGSVPSLVSIIFNHPVHSSLLFFIYVTCGCVLASLILLCIHNSLPLINSTGSVKEQTRGPHDLVPPCIQYWRIGTVLRLLGPPLSTSWWLDLSGRNWEAEAKGFGFGHMPDYLSAFESPVEIMWVYKKRIQGECLSNCQGGY